MNRKTLTSNEDQVRFKIYEGELPDTEGYKELLRIEREQRKSDRRLAEVRYETLSKELRELKGKQQ